MEREYPLIGSVEAERRITEALEQIQSSDRFSELSSQRVENFWNTSIIRAPFIEALTFKELIEVKAENLLKKKSFGNLKIHGLLDALDRALHGEQRRGSFEKEALDKVLQFIAKCGSTGEREALLKAVAVEHDFDELLRSVKVICRSKKKPKKKITKKKTPKKKTPNKKGKNKKK